MYNLPLETMHTKIRLDEYIEGNVTLATIIFQSIHLFEDEILGNPIKWVAVN